MANIEDISDRFREAVNFLMADKVIQSQKNLALEMGLTPSAITGIMKDRSKPTLEQAAYLVHNYQVNPRFLFFGEKPIQINETSSDVVLSELVKDLQRIQSYLKENGFQ